MQTTLTKPIMKTKSFLLLIIGISLSILFSCKNEEDVVLDINDDNTILVCGTKDPINDLKWLSDEMKLRNFFGVYAEKINGVVLFDYKGDKVIELQCSVCSSFNLNQHYCDGTKIDFTNSSNYKDYLKNRTKVKVLYGTEIWPF